MKNTISCNIATAAKICSSNKATILKKDSVRTWITTLLDTPFRNWRKASADSSRIDFKSLQNLWYKSIEIKDDDLYFINKTDMLTVSLWEAIFLAEMFDIRI